MPPSASEYTNAGLPWFEYYGKDQAALPGGEKLASIQSVGSLFKKTTGATLPDSGDIQVNKKIPIGIKAHEKRAINTSGLWDE